MLDTATQDLIALLTREDARLDDLNRTARNLLQSAKTASLDQRNDSLRALAAKFNGGTRSAPLALLCGALLELGADPSPVVEPLLDRLPSLLNGAEMLLDACLEESVEPDPKSFEQIRKRKAALLPGPAAAWEALDQYWCFAIAVLSLSPTARASASSLRPVAAKISPYHQAGHWIERMLSVLDQAPIAVIEPLTRIGLLGRISGVSDNFQLNILLMDGFPVPAGLPPRLSSAVVDMARGRGPQQLHESVKGAWNLYTWQAVQPGLKLPNPGDLASKNTWIWNEGKPEEIPMFDARRVILLGPPPYLRSWAASRAFAHLPAALECERILTTEEVETWLQRMLLATASQRG